MHEALRLAAQLMAPLTLTGDVNHVAVFVFYLTAAQLRHVVHEFAEEVRWCAPERGDDVLTYAERLRVVAS